MDLRRGGSAQEVDAELRPSDCVIDGDGLISAVTFTPGSPVHVRSRYARAPSYRASLKAPGADARVPESLGFTFHGQWVNA